MPAGKSSQSQAMLYTVITFVILFLISATFAVIYYVKAEEYRKQKIAADTKIASLATTREQDSIKNVLEEKAQGKSILGTMNGLVDTLIEAITGQVPGEGPADVKVNNVSMVINEVMESLGDDAVNTSGAEGVDLLGTISYLKAQLDITRQAVEDREIELSNLQDNFDAALAVIHETEDQLNVVKANYTNLIEERSQQYNTLLSQGQDTIDNSKQAYEQSLTRVEGQLQDKQTQVDELSNSIDELEGSLKSALETLESTRPQPDVELASFRPDARILKIDLQTNLVYLDVGFDDHVYKGLTFAVYDRSAPIPEDGKGKAEIEVFDVQEKVCAAQIIRSSKKDPIVPEDIVANLIWDSRTSNKVVIVGAFDFDGDGQLDPDGIDKIKLLIERWGGTAVDTVTVETDFVIRGSDPTQPVRPTTDQIAVDPLAEQRYLKAVEAVETYSTTLDRAKIFRVPVFNAKQFMNLIGYESLANKSTPL